MPTTTTRHLDRLLALLAATGRGGNLVKDAHRPAIVQEHKATVVIFDPTSADPTSSVVETGPRRHHGEPCPSRSVTEARRRGRSAAAGPRVVVGQKGPCDVEALRGGAAPPTPSRTRHSQGPGVTTSGPLPAGGATALRECRHPAASGPRPAGPRRTAGGSASAGHDTNMQRTCHPAVGPGTGCRHVVRTLRLISYLSRLDIQALHKMVSRSDTLIY